MSKTPLLLAQVVGCVAAEELELHRVAGREFIAVTVEFGR